MSLNNYRMTDKIRDNHVYNVKDNDKRSSSESSEEEDEAAMQAALREMVKIPDIDSCYHKHSRHTKSPVVEEHEETWAEKLKRNARIPLLQVDEKSSDRSVQASSSSSEPKQELETSPRKTTFDLTVHTRSGIRTRRNKLEQSTGMNALEKPRKTCKPAAKTHTTEPSVKRVNLQNAKGHNLAEENRRKSESDRCPTPKTVGIQKSDFFSGSLRPIELPHLKISTGTDHNRMSIVAQKLKMVRIEKASRPKVYTYPDRMASTQTLEKATVTVATNTEGEFSLNLYRQQQQKEEDENQTGIINILSVPSRRTLNYETVRELPIEDMTTPKSPEQRILEVTFKNLPMFGRDRSTVKENATIANESQAKEQADTSNAAAAPALEQFPKVTLKTDMSKPDTCTRIKETIRLLAPKAFGRKPLAATAADDVVALGVGCPKKLKRNVRVSDLADIATCSQQDLEQAGSTLTKSRSVTPVTSATQLFLPRTSQSRGSTALSVAVSKSTIRKVFRGTMSSQHVKPDGDTYLDTPNAEQPIDMKDSISTALVRLFMNALVADDEHPNEETPKAGTGLNEVVVMPQKTENNDENLEAVKEGEPVSKSDSRRTLTIIGRDSHIRTKYNDHCHVKDRPEGFDRAAWRKLIFASILCVCFMIVEVIGGILSNSLAIATDAAHLLTDLAGFMISLFAIYLAGRPSSQRLNFGWYRAEVIGAMISVYFIWVITGILVYLAVQRLMTGQHEVNAVIMLITSGMAIAVNVVMAYQLHHGHSHGVDALNEANRMPRARHAHISEPLAGSNTLLMERESHIWSPSVSSLDAYHHFQPIENINVRAAFVHVIGDIVQSVGVFVAAIIIFFKPAWAMVDSICTFIFSIIVLVVTFRILRDVIMVLMEATPDYMDYEEVQRLFLSIDGVVHVHNLRIWALSIDKIALSAHLAIRKDADPQVILEMAKKLIHRRYNLFETTIQIEEYTPGMEDCVHCQQPISSQRNSLKEQNDKSDEKNINTQ